MFFKFFSPFVSCIIWWFDWVFYISHIVRTHIVLKYGTLLLQINTKRLIDHQSIDQYVRSFKFGLDTASTHRISQHFVFWKNVMFRPTSRITTRDDTLLPILFDQSRIHFSNLQKVHFQHSQNKQKNGLLSDDLFVRCELLSAESFLLVWKRLPAGLLSRWAPYGAERSPSFPPPISQLAGRSPRLAQHSSTQFGMLRQFSSPHVSVPRTASSG